MKDPRQLHTSHEKVAHLESALESHAAVAASRALDTLGGPLSFTNLSQFLESCLRFPTVLQFDDDGLEPQQFARPSFEDRDGLRTCILRIRPHFENQTKDLPYIVAYMAATINYLDSASSALCEDFGATLMGVRTEDFYQSVCRISDQSVG